MVQFYFSISESILTSSVTIWHAVASTEDEGRRQHVICSAEKVIGCSLPCLHDLYTTNTLRSARMIAADPSQSGHELFVTLPSGGKLPIRSNTSQHDSSFFAHAVGLLTMHPHPDHYFIKVLQ